MFIIAIIVCIVIVLVTSEVVSRVRAKRAKRRAAEQLADTAAYIPFDRILERTGRNHDKRKRQRSTRK